MTPARNKITAQQLLDIIDKLGLSQTAVAKLVGKDPRTIRRWIAGDPIPNAEAILFTLLGTDKLTADDIRRLATRRP